MSVEALDNISCPIAPVADSHLANKAYVDAAVANGAGTASGSGDNVVSIPATSLISCGLAPTEDSHLVNKAYVDAAVAAAGSATPIEEPAALGRVVYVTTLSDAASHTGTSLRDAIEAVTDKGSVVIKFSVSGTITLEQGEIVIPAGKIAIDGENKIAISGGNVSRVFALTNQFAALSLNRLTVTSGNGVGATTSGQYGGAITLTGTNASLVAQKVTFAENSVGKSGVYSGGAVLYASGTGTTGEFIDCDFTSNAVTEGSSSYGGAIYNTQSSGIYVIGCRFTNNTVTASSNSFGGAIHTNDGLIEDSVFQGNELTAGNTRYGGAVYINGYRGFVKDCKFIGNSAGLAGSACMGGAIVVNQAGYSRISGCELTENSAYFGGGVGFYGKSSGQHHTKLFKCVFDNNSAHASGGRGSALYTNSHTVELEDCEFKNHAVGSASGIVYVYGYTGKIFGATMNRCKFTGNSASATTTGLVYCANLAQVYIYNSVFSNNSFTATSGNHKCVYTTGSNTWAFLYNCTFTNNDNKGGAFYAAAGGVDIYNSVEVGNGSASGKGTNATVNAAKFLSDQSSSTGRDIAYDSTKPLFAADGYTPVAGSQVIDAGDDDYVETVYDLVGQARVSGAAVDVGAVEWQSS